MPDGNIKVAASGRTQYSASLRTAKDQCPAYTDNGINGCLIPFHTQEILQPGGIYYGQNAVSKNLLVADRKKLMNGNSFRLGVSGSGKSFSAKEEIVHLALSTDDDILILDPESEFTKLVEALGGQVVKVSATSDNHLNAMDMDAAYGNEKNPLIEKSEFILSVFEQLVGAGNLSAKEKSILDRCAADVYRDYIRSGYTGKFRL